MQPIPSKWCYLLAPAAGALAPFALAPYELWPLGIISLALLLACLQYRSAKASFVIGWLYGLGLYGAGVFWVYHSIHVYGHAPAPLAAGLTAVFVAGLSLLFCASFGYCFSRLCSHSRVGNLLGFPALWVLFEWLRSWLLTGFPWLFAGYAHTDTTLAAWAPVVGVYGVSFWVALSASALYLLVEQLRLYGVNFRCTTYSVTLLLPWLIALPLSPVAWTQPQGDAIRVTLIQPDISQSVKWLPEQRSKTLNQLYQQTATSLDSDLIIWPENAVPLLHHRAQPFFDDIKSLIGSTESTVISGVPFWQRNEAGIESYHNSITVIAPETNTDSPDNLYHKQKLVPFGEYVPLQQLLRGLIEFFNLPMSDFRRGPADQAPLQVSAGDQTLKIAPYICYEIVYPDFVRAMAKQSDVLLTISDDSWFGESAGPLQHLQMARMRALENGKYLLRDTNTGVTAIIDHHGKIVSRADAFRKEALTGEVWAVSGQTPFSRFGSWPVMLLCAVLVAWSVIANAHHRRGKR